MTPTKDADSEGVGLLVSLCLLLVGVVVAEIMMVLLARQGGGSALRLLAVRHGGWLLMPACLASAYIARPTSVRRMIGLGAVLAVGYVTLTHFRGTWIWPGTFDQYWLSRSFWTVPSLVGTVTGAVFSAMKPVSFDQSIVPKMLIGLGLATVLSAIGPRVFHSDVASVSAASRMLCMAAVLVMLTVAVTMRNQTA